VDLLAEVAAAVVLTDLVGAIKAVVTVAKN
jgi:hypothetical protein